MEENKLIRELEKKMEDDNKIKQQEKEEYEKMMKMMLDKIKNLEEKNKSIDAKFSDDSDNEVFEKEPNTKTGIQSIESRRRSPKYFRDE